MKTTRLTATAHVCMVAAALVATGWLCGCASTYQARTAKPSGFLGDYSQLHKGHKDQPLLVYVNPQADFKKYTKIKLDPISMYVTKPGVGWWKLSPADQQRLANYFDATLREHLATDYTLVDEPGPDVLELRVAITQAKGAKVVLDTVSTVVPMAMAVSALRTVAFGSGTGVGSVGVEFEALDSMSRERLAAAVDARVGRKVTGKFDKLNRWRAAQDSFDFWAERLQTRLREASGKAESI